MARSMGGGRSGGGRSGGGGRSMGGGSRGGSRSFSGSGRSRSSGRSSGGGSNRRIGGSGGFGGGFGGGPRPGGPVFHGGPGAPPPPPRHYHRPYRRRYYGGYSSGPYYGGRPGGGCGCSTTLITFLILMIIVCFALAQTRPNGIGSQSTKLNRDKYTGEVDSSRGYYEDHSEGSEPFIDRNNDSVLISGFKEFYSKTGVFPFLYVVETIPDASAYAGYDTYIDMLYETLFESEGNLLILYVADEDDYYYAAGYDVGEVIDDESLNVISDKVNSYWSTGDLAKAFGNGLEDASKDIMAKSNFRVIMMTLIICAAVIIVICIVFKWWKAKKKADADEAEQLEKILDKPLETFGNDLDDLTKKYDDNGQS